MDGEEHLGAEHFLTGPEAQSCPQLALRFSSVLARPVRPVFVPAPAYRAVLRAAGTDADDLVDAAEHPSRCRLHRRRV